MKTKIAIGRIVKPHGIKGECIVLFYSGNFYIKKYSEYFLLDNKEDYTPIFYTKADVYKSYKNSYIVAFKDVDRNKLENDMINKEIFVNELNYQDLKEDEFYYKDVIGCDIFVEDEFLGKALYVHNFGSSDLIEVAIVKEEKPKNIFLPLQNEFIKKFDLDNKVISFSKECIVE